MKRQEFTQSPTIKNWFIFPIFDTKITKKRKKKWHIGKNTRLHEYKKNRFPIINPSFELPTQIKLLYVYAKS